MTTAILDHTGRPFARQAPARQDLHAIVFPRGQRRINAGYDAAQDTLEMGSYWASADRLDADSANSREVRSKLVSRSRYEVGNNGYVDGMVQTYADYLVGVGPTLRMQSDDQAFNTKVEAAWLRWTKAVQLRRKLWCMAHAKCQDGEAFGTLRINPGLAEPTRLDFVLFETEQCATPYLSPMAAGQIDGVRLDAYGNPVSYDVLPYHPGGAWSPMRYEPEAIPAAFVCHWFILRRPGQHRAVPEFRSTLNVGATGRRWREATVGAAEGIANYALMLESQISPSVEVDPVSPMSTLDVNRKMMTALPQGWRAFQPKAEQPTATYESFNRAQIGEQARPKCMAYNLAACDSSNHNYASGRLDHQPMMKRLDVERLDGNDLVLDKIFPVWFARAAFIEQWAPDPDVVPVHSWDWPKHPVVDVGTEADANDKGLRNGTRSLSQIASEAGIDFEDQVRQMSADYGITPDEMRGVLLRAMFTESIAQESNDYGVAVRAGVITPQVDDEEHFRKRMGLPPVNASVRETWVKDGGTRRPITLSTPEAIQQQADPSANPDMPPAERSQNGGKDVPVK